MEEAVKRALTWSWLALGALMALVPFFALVGLGVHRHAAPWAVSASAMLLVFAPPLGMASAGKRDRPLLLGSGLIAWSISLFLVLPVYFPGERRDAVATGLALTGLGGDLLGIPNLVAARLPDEPAMARPEVAQADPLTVEVPPPAEPLLEHQIALPYEGEGRRLSVPVIFGTGGTEVEVEMMLDTGATYTTLDDDTLAALGVFPSSADPIIRLHTANGERDAHIVLLDSVWLGDLRLDGVAIATCNDCGSSDTSGLLGLNVAGAFNLQIDADRREVVFSRRERLDRRLDVKPFSDLSATFTRFPGGRVEVAVQVENVGRRPIDGVTTSVRCKDDTWLVELGPIARGEVGTARRKLPAHEPCLQYEIAMHEARW
jgi:clan AA aspartic protease (TIGR02281 family)